VRDALPGQQCYGRCCCYGRGNILDDPQSRRQVQIFSHELLMCLGITNTKLILGPVICVSQTHITYMCLWFTNTKLILGLLHLLYIYSITCIASYDFCYL
jgi:hypothetical protein